ncbi:hypothetical protein DP113_18115 [Brasilonema octagenarum UFV-E1]|uniref:Uncharacterized protein n=2 Tax=Brasilonema TaxID=383614 RepID=A0A856MH40_9CYAN|nr:hypothetical protein [Brasilonema octagenarum UFV-OR1]QDL09564.1 hypothetical protein DP114_18185 [Brasilonema sennae CENA114]QDL15919.1 hypothetical protein DP113_18115 [Brasilonema octagenarum UFV-E1]
MPKHPSQKVWQKTHKDKIDQYQRKYLDNKVRICVVLDKELVGQIDRVKPSDQTYASWIKRISRDWLSQHTVNSLLPNN